MNSAKLCILFLLVSLFVVGCIDSSTQPPDRCPILAPFYGHTKGTMPAILDWSNDGKQVLHGVYNPFRFSGLMLADIEKGTTSSIAISDGRIQRVLSAEFSPLANEILIETEEVDENLDLDVPWILVLDGEDYSVLEEIGQGYRPLLSPDGAKISFRKYPLDRTVWSISTIDRQNNTVAEFEVQEYYWSSQYGIWHPLDDLILMVKSGDVQNEPNELAVLDLATSKITDLTDSTDCEGDARWSPQTGNKISYVGYPTGNRNIFLMDADGHDTKNLTHSLSGHVLDYNWSPDGKTIVFTSLNPIDFDLYHQDLFLVDVETEEIQQLTSTDGVDEFAPVWSPDGNRIAYFVERPSSDGVSERVFELHVVDVASGESQMLNSIDW